MVSLVQNTFTGPIHRPIYQNSHHPELLPLTFNKFACNLHCCKLPNGYVSIIFWFFREICNGYLINENENACLGVISVVSISECKDWDRSNSWFWSISWYCFLSIVVKLFPICLHRVPRIYSLGRLSLKIVVDLLFLVKQAKVWRRWKKGAFTGLW
jgi:hypothetical protein